MRAKLIENRKMIENISEIESWFFEKIWKNHKYLALSTKNKPISTSGTIEGLSRSVTYQHYKSNKNTTKETKKNFHAFKWSIP